MDLIHKEGMVRHFCFFKSDEFARVKNHFGLNAWLDAYYICHRWWKCNGWGFRSFLMQLWIKYTELPIWWYTAETARLTQSTLFTLNDWLAIVCSGVEEKCANRFNPSFIHCHSFPAPLDFNQGGCFSSSASTHCIPNRPQISSKLIHICVVGVDRPLLPSTKLMH